MTKPSQQYAIGVDDIRRAAERIDSDVVRTPIVGSEILNSLFGAELFFKCENLQHIGAFKARGACNAVLSLDDDAASAGVVTHSSGNHAAALARAAQLRRIPAHIIMPENSAAVKVAAVRRLGVEPVWSDPTAESRQAVADQVQRDTGATFVHPYNNADVMAGQGTATLEFLEQVTDLDVLIVPVGGGGLLSGSLIAAKSMRPDLQVMAAEPAWADDAFRSLQTGQIEAPTRYDTIADGLRTPLGSLTFPMIRDLVDGILLAGEDEIKTAASQLLKHAKLVVEPSGAVPLAVLSAHQEKFAGKRVGLIISGGNADPDVLRQLV